MLIQFQEPPVTFAQVEHLPESFGFRNGVSGAHAGRTMMLAELRLLLQGNGPAATKAEYCCSIVEENLLGKRTLSGRKETARRLTSLYGLDPRVTVFRLMRHFWDLDEQARPLLALLCALARDPVFRHSMGLIRLAPIGEVINKYEIETIIAQALPEHFGAKTLSSIGRNIISSWSQSGFLVGRTVKRRSQPLVSAGTVAFALILGFLAGEKGQMLFETCWVRILGLSASEVMALTYEASRRGWIDYRAIGSVVDIRFSDLLTSEEWKWLG